jgi:hypothetical protein
MPDAVQGASSRMASNSWTIPPGGAGLHRPRPPWPARPRRCRVLVDALAAPGVHIQRRTSASTPVPAGARSCRRARHRRPANAGARAGCRPFKQQGSGHLGGGVLHRTSGPQQSPATPAPGVHWSAPGLQAPNLLAMMPDSASVSAVEGWRGLSRIDAQRQGAGGVVGLQDGLPAAQGGPSARGRSTSAGGSSAPPGRVGRGTSASRSRRNRRRQALTKPAAHCNAAGMLGSFDRLVDQRKYFIGAPAASPRPAPARHSRHPPRGGRAAGQLAPQGFGAAQLAQRLECQRLHAGRSQAIHGGQRIGGGAARAHGAKTAAAA